MLDVLDAETAERNREPLIVTTDGGPNGSIDSSGDDDGAGDGSEASETRLLVVKLPCVGT